jgi:hypothetical protein
MISLVNQSFADEGGTSFWLPGQMGSFSASPSEPGWSIPLLYYYSSVKANASKSFLISGRVNAGLKARSDLFMVTPSYVFNKPIIGGQASIAVTGFVGRYTIDANASLVGPFGTIVTGQRKDTLTSVGDLFPTATLRWNYNVHNFMVYAMGDIPVGAYDINRLANMGLNHWSFDGGGGYTYLDEANHHEFSAVIGFTENFENPATHYKNGVDGHIDWSAAQFLSDNFFIGPSGYVFKQITGDTGTGARLGDFKSQIYGIGPQFGAFFKIGEQKWYMNLKVMHEFAAKNRPTGWNGWVSLTTA